MVTLTRRLNTQLHSFARLQALHGDRLTDKGGNVTSAGWQVTLCNPILHVSSRDGEAVRQLLYFVYLLTYLYLPSVL